MDIQGITLTLVNNALQLITAFIITLIQRWLLGISTYEKDKTTFKKSRFYRFFERVKWYRGREIFHQARAYKLLKDAEI